jgi:hypothetical protein
MRRPVMMAEVERLPREDRDAVETAVSEGRAVDEERLAPVAARWAAARRQRIADVCFGLVGPMVLLVWTTTVWVLERDDPDGWGLAVTLGAYPVIGVLSLVVWRFWWRPLVRAEAANLAVGGAGAPVRRVGSRWGSAWFGAFWISWLLGLVLGLLDVSVGPLGVVLWWLLVLAVKHEIDRRGAGA